MLNTYLDAVQPFSSSCLREKKALVKDVLLGIIIKRKTSFMSKEKEGLIQMAVVYL